MTPGASITDTATAPQALDRNNPWPGLAPFDEADSGYFHGRQAETAELLRLVRREPLTVLFGRSGLGKSSLLKAGLFPALRGDDFLPVYLRLDHAPAAPPLADQLQRALQAACAAGQVQASPPAAGEGLWSSFHRRDAEFWSARNRPVTPVIVLDQFEEIFTVGQDSDGAAARAAAFLAALADLVENRPPAAVKQALERDPAAAGKYDFRRASVKLVLSFREDFLAPMEELKAAMPSVMVNRLRLLPMDGHQAYAVVMAGGGALVDDAVARCILRLAWKNEPAPPVGPAEFERIEIDPALLSVVCTELNHKRLATTPPLASITPALLAGADREILAGFYERAMAGLGGPVRAFVEDELITDRGFRDSHDWDDALALPGVSREALAALIARRLLRVDERQGQHRLELTHDVLTRVVMHSRDGRRAREAEAAAQVREQRAFAQQRRNRRNGALVAAGMALMLLLAGVAGWQVMEANRARALARQKSDEAQLSQALALTSAAQAASQQARADTATALARAEQASASVATAQADAALQQAETEKQRANRIGLEADLQKRKADQLVAQARSARLMATADPLQASQYDASLLVNLEALRVAATPEAQAGLLRRFDSQPHLVTFLAGHKEWISAVAFSPDGRRLASASSDGAVIVWDVGSRQALKRLDRHKDRVVAISFSPDSHWLTTADLRGTLVRWDVDGTKPPEVLNENADLNSALAFSRDGRWIAGPTSQGVLVWDLARKNQVVVLEPVTGQVREVAFSPDGKRLAGANNNKTVVVWDLTTGKTVARLEGHANSVQTVTFSPDGQWLASAGLDKTIIVWDASSLARKATLTGHDEWIGHLAFSADSQRLASASRDGTAIVWDHATGDRLSTLRGPADTTGLAFSPDGKWMANGSGDSALVLWDLDHRKLQTSLFAHEGEAYGVAFSRDGQWLATAHQNRRVVLWSLKTRRPSARFEAPAGQVLNVAFSPDSRSLAFSANEDPAVIRRQLQPSMPLSTLEGRPGGAHFTAFSPDGRQLAVSSGKDSVLIWDLASDRPPTTLAGHTNGAFVIAFSPDGKRLAASTGLEFVQLSVLDGQKSPVRIDGHQGVAFSPDGQWLATSSGKKDVGLWNPISGRPLAALEGHRDLVHGVAFSPDSQWLASGSDDQTVVLWDPAGRKRQVTLTGHSGPVYGVAFSPDGKQLASASKDESVILRDLSPQSLQAEACRTANRNLSCAEWRQHIGPDVPYRKTCDALPGPAGPCQ